MAATGVKTWTWKGMDVQLYQDIICGAKLRKRQLESGIGRIGEERGLKGITMGLCNSNPYPQNRPSNLPPAVNYTGHTCFIKWKKQGSKSSGTGPTHEPSLLLALYYF